MILAIDVNFCHVHLICIPVIGCCVCFRQVIVLMAGVAIEVNGSCGHL